MIRITIDGVVQEYKGGFRLGPVSLKMTDGVTCLLGANGSGKTTLLRMLTGIDDPAAGSIEFDAGGDPGKLKSVGFLPQDFSAPKNATCQDFLYYVAWSRRVPAKRREAMIKTVLSRTGLVDQSSQRIGKLSGGMLRRLGLAQAIIHEPRFVVLDEPTVGLDPSQRLRVRSQVRELAVDAAVVYSTHLVEDVRALADQIVVLRKGKVAFTGTTAEIEQSIGDRNSVDESGDATRLERGISALMDDAG